MREMLTLYLSMEIADIESEITPSELFEGRQLNNSNAEHQHYFLHNIVEFAADFCQSWHYVFHRNAADFGLKALKRLQPFDQAICNAEQNSLSQMVASVSEPSNIESSILIECSHSLL